MSEPPSARARKMFRPLVEATCEPMILIDRSGRICEWNSAAHRLFRWNRDQAISQKLTDLLLPDGEKFKFAAMLDQTLRGDSEQQRFQRNQMVAQDQTGLTVPVEFSLHSIPIAGEDDDCLIAVSVRGLQHHRASEQRLVKQANEARLLHQATLISATAETFEDALGKCLAVMCEVTGWPIGHVWLPDEAGEQLVSSDLWRFANGSANEALIKSSQGVRLRLGEGLPGRIWQRGQPDWVADTSLEPSLPRFREQRDLGVRGAFGFPVFADGEIAAVVEFLSPDQVEPDPHLLLLVGTLGSHLGRVVEQRRWDEDRGRLAAIVDSSYDAIIGKSLDGTIVSWNGGAELVYGYTADEAVGKHSSLVMPDQSSEEESAILDVSEHGIPLRQFEAVRRRKDGTLVDVSITVSPIRDARGRIIGTATIERDTTLRKRREQELERATQQAQAANQAKSEFLANISHELRTPMNAIIGMVELSLCEHSLPALVRDYLETARDSSHILLALMNDLLDFSRMEAGRFELELDPFRLRRTLNEAMRILSLRAHEKGLELTCEVNQDVPNFLEGDARRLRQIVMNLVGNAIKFTDDGDVTVSVSVEEFHDDEVQLLISVTDTGSGIPPEHHHDIFEPFTQVDASTTRQQSGTGLGLAICRELVERMGGEIGVESQLGKGTRFYVTPRFRVIQDDDTVPGLERRLNRLRGLQILVVDDNATNRRILEEQLSHWGMKPQTASTGEQALRQIQRAAAQNHPFSLLLIDALMPGMDGFTLIETIQSQALMRGPTILMLSSADRQPFEERCRTLNIASYLEKPVSQSALLDAIMTALKRSVVNMQAIRDITSTLVPLSILVAEDTPANQKVVRAILERRGHSVTLARNGQEAVEMHCTHDYNLILMDVQMPTMDGLQATAQIRSLPDDAKARVPIVAMTAHAMKRDRQRCLAAGMDAYIAKPIDAEALIELVETTECTLNGNSMRNAKQPRDSSSNARAPSRPEPQDGDGEVSATSDAIDLRSARSRMGSDSLLRDMASFYLEDAPELVTSIQNALRKADGEAVARHAHSLKGLAANFDAASLMVVARQVEEFGRSNDIPSASAQIGILRDEAGKVAAALARFCDQAAKSS